MRQVERGALGLDDPVARYIPAWRDEGAVVVTLRDLLAHCSGLPAHVPFFRQLAGRQAFEDAIVRTPRAYEPRTTSIYSDLGFMLLGFILESIATLETQFDTMRLQMGGIQDLQFNPPALWKSRTAPTRLDPWRDRLLVGEVDDDNAWALGGAAGHAGLFGAVASVGECARHWLQVLEGRTGVFTQETARDVRDSSQRHHRKLARARLGHDAGHVIVRHAHVIASVRSRGFYGDVVVD